jgi:hypothetical protein
MASPLSAQFAPDERAQPRAHEGRQGATDCGTAVTPPLRCFLGPSFEGHLLAESARRAEWLAVDL